MDFCDSPASFLRKILGELNGIPDSSWIFFSNESKEVLPPCLEEFLSLSSFNFFYEEGLPLEFKFYHEIQGNAPAQMAKLYLGEECIAIYLTIERDIQQEPVKSWLQDLKRFWILEPQEALFYQESGLTFGFKQSADSNLWFYALDETKAMDLLKDHLDRR